jgi:hypothetical protein
MRHGQWVAFDSGIDGTPHKCDSTKRRSKKSERSADSRTSKENLPFTVPDIDLDGLRKPAPVNSQSQPTPASRPKTRGQTPSWLWWLIIAIVVWFLFFR